MSLNYQTTSDIARNDMRSAYRELMTARRDFLRKNWVLPPVGDRRVTALAYFFRRENEADSVFAMIETAILETWRNCGMLKTVVVTDRPCSAMRDFHNHFKEWVDIQIEPSLTPGSISTLSLDCIRKLHARFSTPYVLTIQDDGFPLRPGLSDFVGKADFIGAPQCRNILLVRLANYFIRWWPANGGFSLRSKRICELAAHYWELGNSNNKALTLENEDDFYTRTLVRKYPRYRYGVKIADAGLASRFALDLAYELNIGARCPFGFHSARAFFVMQERFGIWEV